ncbi:Nucleotidylyl transferase [Exidia glandulosa HHB12029]|uniref:Nicotinamide-nucleotide adenylyltransferase n=1 Tax=Exidia glandulosa HHB12029 TaxID=1314781 RepID=A0A165IPM3_EXIGL|nr:Nucleotidylyl transferase [Exidia glandulosa HHB12029]
MAVDYVRQSTEFEVVAGFLSPVSDAYKKPGLLSAAHRLRMCELAVEHDSAWLMVDPWEAQQPEYQRTAVVLDHFEHELNEVLGGVLTPDGQRKPVRVLLLAGSDMIATMSEPGVWSAQDLEHILGRYGTFIVERAGSDVDTALDSLRQWRDNIHVIRQTIQNDVSSTKVRLYLRRNMSVRYLIPSSVIEYINQHGLYLDETDKGAGSWLYKQPDAAPLPAATQAPGSPPA